MLKKIKADLKSYLPADRAELAYRRKMLDLLTLSDDPRSRQSFEPGHFTASALVLSPDRRHLLLIHHRFLDLWIQPGGHLSRADDSPAAAAARELREETALELEPQMLFDVDIHTIPPRPQKGEPRHQHFDLRYLFLSPGWELAPELSEVKAAQWRSLEQELELNPDASVRRSARKLLEWKR